ncbi:MAG: hypothetical protein K940chlam8_00994 [Chlamydiae bacterium]|nr:hypothetical protein [Chlamydiota bacterium]
MVAEVQTSENISLEQWPYFWELTNEDQTKRVTVIGQTYLLASNQYPEAIQKKAFNAKVLVSELPKGVAEQIQKQGFLQWMYQNSKNFFDCINQSPAKIDQQLRVYGYSDVERQNIQSAIQKLKQLPKNWHQKLTPTQRVQVQKIISQFAPNIKFEDMHPVLFMGCLSNYSIIQQFVKNNLLTDAVVKNQKKETYHLDDKKITFVKKMMKKEGLNVSTWPSRTNAPNFSDNKVIFEQLLKVVDFLSNMKPTEFCELIELIHEEILENLEDTDGDGEAYYLQEAKVIHHIAMHQLVNERSGIYGKKRMAAWEEKLGQVIDKHDDVTIIADVESMKSEKGVLAMLQRMGFDEVKQEA